MDLFRRLPDEGALNDLGKLVVRLMVAGLMLLHGIHKVLYGIDGVREILAEKGIPLFTAYGVYVGEVIAPLLILVGWWSRPAGLILAFNMFVAIATDHASDVLRLGKNGQSAIEVPLLFLFGGLAVAFLGPGRHSASHRLGRGSQLG